MNTPDSKPKKHGKQNTEPAAPPKVPASAIRVARVGGTLAMIPAAAISAQTLFRLGLMMGLPPSIAWLLPAALDIYAVTSIWVGFQVPEGHRARKSAIWNARFALALTVICNALSHALDLAAMKHGWSRRDLALTLVSALPPIVVERLLHLQTMIATDGATDAATDSGRQPTADSAPLATATDSGTVTTTPASTDSRSAANPAVNDSGRKLPTAPAAKATGDNANNSGLLAATAIAYRDIRNREGRRPTAPELVAAVDGLNTDSRAKQLRAEIEQFPEFELPLHLVDADRAVS